jgi:hypothetical protein
MNEKKNEKLVECSLWFAGQEPYARIQVCSIEWKEWKSYIDWASPPGIQPQDPVTQMDPSTVTEMYDHIESIDWNTVPTVALGGMTMLYGFLKQAHEQRAGAWIEIC